MSDTNLSRYFNQHADINENLQDELIVQYLEHFAHLSKHGETAEVRECARLELYDYMNLLSADGVN